nr:PREDICTED: uncharacterized protein LOC103281651 [Anolis carolinensis]|eukprot:XP_016854179.1 PREDICTED: uncharacterized protein LOC103281651 [Anolis carolinensis]
MHPGRCSVAPAVLRESARLLPRLPSEKEPDKVRKSPAASPREQMANGERESLLANSECLAGAVSKSLIIVAVAFYQSPNPNLSLKANADLKIPVSADSFDSLCITRWRHVGLRRSRNLSSKGSSKDPEVRRQFPEDYGDQEILQTLTKFCFPFYVDSITVGQVGQNFTFVLTDIDSKQRFGFCRLSSGAKTCFCILSYLPWFEVFYKLLNILADYTAKSQDSQWYELLDTLYKLPIPQPGSSVHLSVHSYFTVPDIRELPSIPENVSKSCVVSQVAFKTRHKGFRKAHVGVDDTRCTFQGT